MDNRVTRSVRLEPQKWEIVISLQEQRRLPSMGAALDMVLDWWVASAPIREKMAKGHHQ